MRQHHRAWAWRLALILVAAGIAAVAGGCGGGGGERANNLRPPVTVNVAVTVAEKRVTVSPRKLGAGPLNIVVSNQSNASRRLTIDGPRLRQSVGPINPEDTANLRLTVGPGQYTFSADDATGVKPATLTVGQKRPSAQNDLLLP